MRYVTCEEISLNKPDHKIALHLGLPEMNAIQQSTSTSIQENASSFYCNPAHAHSVRYQSDPSLTAISIFTSSENKNFG